MLNKKIFASIIMIAVLTPCVFTVIPKKDSAIEFTPKDMAVPLPAYTIAKPTATPTPTPVPPAYILRQMYRKNPIMRYVNSVEVSITYLELESLGTYYITAYCDCSKCCGIYANGATASGEYCHYSDDDYEPTTCAIDRGYHSFGELLWVDDKLYVAEDTGSAVIGRHIDIYLPSHDEVETYGSHYSEVYSARFVTTEGRRLDFYVYDYYLHDYYFTRRDADWNDSRKHD